MAGENTTFSYDEVKEMADMVGLTPEEFAKNENIIISGKQTVPEDTTPPTEPEKKTAAGDSSLADTSLESPEANQYSLTLDDISGSEEEVREKLQQRLRAIGIEIDETGVLFDAIKLTSLTKNDEEGDPLTSSVYLTENRENNLKLINQYITDFADETYAESLKEGRADILAKHEVKIKNISVSNDDVENWQISSWQNKEAEKQSSQMKSTPGAPMAFTQVSSKLTSADFKTDREYEQYLEWKNNGIVDMTPSEISKAKSIVLEEERNAASKEYIRTLSDEDREAVETIAAFENQKNKARLNNLDVEIKNLNNEAVTLQADIDAFNAKPTSEEQAAILRSRTAELLIKEGALQDFIEDAEVTQRIAGDLSKNYSMLSKLGVNFKKTGLDIGYGAFQVLMATGSLISEGEIESGVKLAEQVAKPRLQDIERELASYDEGVQFSRIGKTGNFTTDVINWAGNTSVQAIPSLSLAFTGPAAMPLFFASGYGSTAAEQAVQEYEAIKRIQDNKKLLEDPNVTQEEKAAIEAAIDDDAKIVNMPAWREMTTSAVAGFAEVAFERVGTVAILKGVNRTVSTNKKQIVKSILKSANQEGLTEAATELTNNWAKINILGEEEVNLFDNIAESYFGGALIGGPLELKHAMPAIYTSIAHSAMTGNEIREYRNKIDKLKKLTGIENLDSLLNSRMPLPDGLSAETKSLIRDIQESGELLQDQAVQRLQKRLSTEEIIELGEVNMRMRQINNRLIKAARSGVSQSELTAIKEELQSKFDELSRRREVLLTNQASQAETARAKTNIRTSIAFAEASTIVFQKEIEVKKRNSDIAFNLLDATEKTKLIEENNGDEAEAKYQYYLNNNKKQLEDDYNRAQVLNSENGKVAVIKRMTDAEFKQAFPDADESVTAFEKDGEIYVNEDAAAARGQVGVYTHEIFHTIAKQTIGSGKANEAGERLLEYLEKEAGEVYDYIKNKLDVLYTEDGVKDDAYYEEAMTALSDYIAEGNTIELGALTQVNRFLDKLFNKVAPGLSIKDGQQTFEFIVQYASKNRGKKAEEALKTFLRSVADDAEEELSEKAKDAKISKKSRSAAAGRAADKLAKLQEEGYDPNSIELYESLQGMVGAQLSKYQAKGLQITDEEEAVSDVVSRLYTQRDVNKFDGRGTLYGYLNGRIKFRILDALKAGPVWVENFEDIDVDSLEGKATKQIASEDVETEVVQPAVIETVEEPSVSTRPEYKNLIKRRVVEPEVIKSIEGKVLRTVRLLKSRIDAKVSKNVTVTPIIKEIKKEMGKQADIDLKTAMGGKKDGELRKFLLRNKAAILENMSTTWLSTAMPIAIQKSVDGVWTSDWKDKKIDREKTTTDLAGRTSGADLVRRLPRAAIVISDADFLATILQPDGNPIRGKKESLAKAMAEELSFDIIKKALQDPNSDISQALIENQQRLGVENAENIGAEFARQTERGNVKFSKGIGFEKARLAERLKNLDQRSRYSQRAINKILQSNFGENIFNLKNQEELDKYIDIFIEKVAPKFPMEFWLKPNTIETVLLGKKTAVYGMKPDQFKYARARIKERVFGIDQNGNAIPGFKSPKWGPAIEGLEGYRIYDNKGVEITAERIFDKEENINGYRDTEMILRYNRMVETLHKEMWLRLNEIIEEEKANGYTDGGETVRMIATWLSMAVNDAYHPARRGATIAGYTKNYVQRKGNVTLEHATPNIWHIQLLLEEALKAKNLFGQNSDFEKVYESVARNYVLIALSIDEDKKLNKTGLTSTMPKDYDYINGNWGERYFNEITGINPNDLILISGKTYAEVARVDAKGRYISDKFVNFLLSQPKLVALLKKERKDKFGAPTKSFLNLAENPITEQIALSFLAQIALESEQFKKGQRKYSKGFPPAQVLNNEFNNMLERGSGISAEQQFSRIRGQLAGKGKGRFKFFIAPGADDFRGLVHYAFAGKGAQGDKDMAFLEKNLMEPYFKGIAAIDTMRQQIKREFKVVTKEFQAEYKMLSESIPGTPFTYDHALRVYMWASQGTNIPGLSAQDQSLLENAILDNPQLADLGEALMIVGRKETWPKPSEFWEGDSVLADLNSMTEKIGRKEILAQFIENADAIFSEENLNKIEAIKGRAHREAIEDALYSMKSGVNRPSGANRQMNKWLNWINGSTGAIMFFNRRSALLQMLSFTNFINWSDNNPAKAAMAFANQAQYWKDWVYIFNSDKLKERRGGLKQDVSDSEIAQVAGQSKNSPQAILAKLLQLGFTPTQIADSMAIATGGASYYRNRINTYLKQGKSVKEAEEQAFLDFSKVSDEAQQSSDPALVSQQQRSVLGRLVLAFANTPMQYTRLMKKAGQDLINGRGDWKTNVSKIAYYGFVQNFIFSALQSALFALMFDDEEENEEKAKEIRDKKIARTFDSMLDTVLRGSGIYGAVASTVKNTIKTYLDQEEKGYMADHTYTLLSALNLSPPIGSKLRKLYGAIQTRRFEADNMKERGWAITADGRLNLGPNWAITGSIVSGVLNVPLDRVVAELTSISEALDSRNKTWQRIALALGWKTWDVGARNEEADLIKTQAKEKRKEEGIKKSKETRAKNKKSKDYEEAFEILTKEFGYTKEQAREELKDFK